MAWCVSGAVILAFLVHVPGVVADEDSREGPYELDEVDKRPRLIKRIRPVYPHGALRDNIEGRVTMRGVVTKAGTVKSPSVLKAFPKGAFDKAALAAFRKYRYRPAMKDGNAVEVVVTAEVEFSIVGISNTDTDTYRAVDDGVRHMRQGRYRQAIAAFTSGIQSFPLSDGISAAYGARGLAYKMVKEYENALSDFNRSIKLNPRQVVTYINRGDVHVALGKYTKAVDDYTAAIGLDGKNARSYAGRGETHLKMSELPETIEDCTEAIRLNPELLSTYFTRGNAYLKMKKYRESIDDYSHVITGKPTFMQAYYNRGASYGKLGEREKMCRDLTTVCALGDCVGLRALKRQDACIPKQYDLLPEDD